MQKISFADLALLPPLQTALQESGYVHPTPIQEQAIPAVLEGHDILGIAQTGTGKTAAFCLPILQIIATNRWSREARRPAALILTPTRELAIQIHESLETYGKHLRLKHAVIFGGVGQGPQVKALQSGCDVLVATPGRLLDLIQQRFLSLDRVQIFVLDEADRMLDMGFMQDIRRILPLLPKKTHNLFFSATMPTEIQKLANTILKDPKKIEVTPASTTVEKIDQSVLFVDKKDKLSLLLHLLKDRQLRKVLVFVQMKHGANRVVEKLEKNGVSTAAIHGNKSQGARQRAIEHFASGQIRVLVATDIASRGIDIDGITHVINLELPHLPESYVHRIGRTARAGTDGQAISLCGAEERSFLYAIEKTTRQQIRVVTDQPFHSESVAKSSIMSVGKAKAAIEGQRDSRGGGRHQRGRRPPGRRGGPSSAASASHPSGPRGPSGGNSSRSSGSAPSARGPAKPAPKKSFFGLFKRPEDKKS